MNLGWTFAASFSFSFWYRRGFEFRRGPDSLALRCHLARLGGQRLLVDAKSYWNVLHEGIQT